ncbi:zinc finger protein 667-like [Melitaea cinxia]|uniref:zinc finger protein 667-like n=1 Tax=Melitaea cinxia TaxID=113334 RepID=UPI001E274B4D|nr:zinc finger protein 667-like [Melitaea cinxia]
MRTYARKRTEYQVIEGVHEMCRLCLEKVNESVPIFSDNDNICASLTMRIMMCVGLEIKREDCLPNVICTECQKELNNYYEFKKKCVLTYQKLKSHVLAVKQLGTKQKIDVKSTTEDTPNNGDTVVDVIRNNTVNDFSVLSSDIVEKPATEPNQSIVNASFQQDVSEFLSTILVELGILSQNGDHVILMDQNVSLIEIETEDNSKIVLEVLEINEEQQKETNNEISNSEINTEPTFKLIEPSNTEKNVIQPKKESRVRCAECGKRFASSGALRRHARVHSGERPFVCAQCGHAFAQREVLRRHELVHRVPEQRPFPCPSCARSFTQRGALAAHARSHARALALHRCARCPRVFLHASGLSRHTKVHSGRVFTCVVCQRCFSDKSSLLRHLRAKHPKIAEQGTA